MLIRRHVLIPLHRSQKMMEDAANIEVQHRVTIRNSTYSHSGGTGTTCALGKNFNLVPFRRMFDSLLGRPQETIKLLWTARPELLVELLESFGCLGRGGKGEAGREEEEEDGEGAEDGVLPTKTSRTCVIMDPGEAARVAFSLAYAKEYAQKDGRVDRATVALVAPKILRSIVGSSGDTGSVGFIVSETPAEANK